MTTEPSRTPTIGGSDATRIAVASAIGAVTNLVILTVAARVLLPVENNTAFVTFWSTLFAFFGVMTGFSIEATRAVSAATSSEDRTSVPTTGAGRPPRVMAVGVGIACVVGLLVGVTIPVWSPAIFTMHPWALGGLVVLGVTGNALHAATVGSLAGSRIWRPYSSLIGFESLVRLTLVLVCAFMGLGVLGFAAAAAAAAFTWAGFVATSSQVRHAVGVRVDSTLPLFLRRVTSSGVASGASALLVVGFPVLLSLTTPDAEMALAAPVLMAITLTRAPLMIPLNAYQGVAVTHFVAHRDQGLRAMLPAARLVVLVGVVGAVLALLVGPQIMALVFGSAYRVPGLVLAGLTLAVILLALLTLTGALCQALTMHGPFVAGWVTAVLVSVATLLVPASLEARSVLALAAGPVAGLIVHLTALRRAALLEVAANPSAVEQSVVDQSIVEQAVVEQSVLPDAVAVADGGLPVPRVSVCIATYNGERFVDEQLRSILDQLAPSDEVVVVDDASTDTTVAVVQAIADPRVRLVPADRNRGYVATFEAALAMATGEHVLLSDQDDVWVPGRVQLMVDALVDVDVVATNLGTLGGPESIRGPYGQADWHLRAADSRHPGRNILGTLAGNRPYYGCAMGVRRSALARVLPFPSYLDESHDLWIALYGNVFGSIQHVEARSLLRRFHEDNASPNRPRGPLAVVRSRAMLVRVVVDLVGRRFRSAAQERRSRKNRRASRQ
ncbi:glycosyltransferase [Sanguibacter antarcticus]|uniref:Glycosyltransferase involved in cell wall biosynthesis n=1 Tax=Sanguibacter antarcticus TaxID=372484 RepID=A0A2A9E1T5_9MICO|nr:glycosyltransferase [Sanguibacter antarcticus]PFG32531.1 glycosyltransferase involved in cell wall biosynthesis [Sanguibacter antarcticus]